VADRRCQYSVIEVGAAYKESIGRSFTRGKCLLKMFAGTQSPKLPHGLIRCV
jgi:hypothetical protein